LCHTLKDLGGQAADDAEVDETQATVLQHQEVALGRGDTQKGGGMRKSKRSI
jgi:hypothetical protein